MSIASLTLRYTPEDQFHGELFAIVKDHDDVGFGSAWFNFSDLCAFVESLRGYPISDETPPRITGGEGLTEEGTFPLRKTLDLQLLPVSGRVLVGIHLETGFDQSFRQTTDMEFRTTYGTLESFRRVLVRVLHDGDPEAEAVLIAD